PSGPAAQRPSGPAAQRPSGLVATPTGIFWLNSGRSTSAVVQEVVSSGMTITTKELRRDLQHVHHAVRRGVHVQITFYGRLWGVLIPARQVWEEFSGKLRDDCFRDAASLAPDLLDVDASREHPENPTEPEGQEHGPNEAASPSPSAGRSSHPAGPARTDEKSSRKPLFAVRSGGGFPGVVLPRRRESLIRCAAPDSGYLLTESAVIRYHMGDEEALEAFREADSLAISAFTHMQLISNRYLRRYAAALEQFLDEFNVQRLNMDSTVTHRALTLMELFGYLSSRSIGLYPEEAIIAATALATGMTVLATEVGRYAQIPNLKVAELTKDGVFPVTSTSDRPPIGPNRLKLNGPYMVGTRW
ncbi:MAG: hypothetical protein WD492_05105, partial [Alkalispirochaeta sp.]